MNPWLMWLIAGAIMILLEFIIPGGIIVFLGVAALTVGGLIHMGWVDTVTIAFISWFIISIIYMLFLRSIFMKYFEGDSEVHNVNEDEDLLGSLVEVVEEIFPHSEGRVKFRNTSWVARSEEELKVGSKAVISGRDGNHLIVKSLL
ncbi:MAG: NfeD family protein [Bacteriovoracaceae bacterium]